MTQDKIKKIHLIYGCIAAVLIVALGIWLMVSAWQIYQSGAHPYTRASVGAKLQNMSVLIYMVGAVVAGGFALNIVLPLEKKKTIAVRDELTRMNKLAAKAGNPSGEESSAIQNEQSLQKLLPVVTAILYATMLIWPAIYMLNGDNFPGSDPTAEIMKAALIVLPFCLIGLGLCHICSVLVTGSILRQTAIYKQIIAANKGHTAPAPATVKKGFPLLAIRWAVFVFAMVLIVAGIFNGSADDVLTKAIKICTECIGLG